MADVPFEQPKSPALVITPHVRIPRAELQFRTSRSSGPGGQHVNKVETRVELRFDLLASPSLDEVVRARLLDELRPWLDDAGILHVVSDAYRSQYRNREDATARFVALLQHALRPRTPRKPTRIPRGVREARLQDKRRRGETKRRRRGDE
jgi:ribosome-associated protein